MGKEHYKETPESDQSTLRDEDHELILINDDVHTFDYVIDALVEVCGHTTQQATQCTMIVHYKGSCDIKKGTFKILRPMRKALLEKDLRAKIL